MPEDGDGVHPWNDCALEPHDVAVGLRRFWWIWEY